MTGRWSAIRLADASSLADILSESLDEQAIREHLLRLVPAELPRAGEVEEAFLFAPARRPTTPLVMLVGHYDTVPAEDNLPGRIEDGAVHGLGASDSRRRRGRAGAVRDLASETVPFDVGLVLFGREELPDEHNPLPALFAESDLLREASLAIVLEPTDCRLQLGCVGNLNARVVFHGVSGHAARPWLADNAIERAVTGLAPIAGARPARGGGRRPPLLRGRDADTAQRGHRRQRRPGPRRRTPQLRYAPDRDPEEAAAYLRSLLPDGATLELAGNSPAAAPASDSPLVQKLREAGDLAVEPKQAWTNVADFAARGIPAVNLGPGATRYAHARDEQVEIASLVRVYEVLRRFLTS